VIRLAETAGPDRVYRWNDRAPSAWSLARLFEKSRSVFRYKWPSFISTGSRLSRSTLLQTGKYEWPFELEIKGSAAESIDGLSDSHISYNLRATITRGSLGSVLHTHKPVRIIRAFPLAALSLTGPVREEGVWPDKIEYQFFIPQRAIVFGTALSIQMRLATLLKGLGITMINCALIESQEFRMPGSPPERSFKRLRTVEQWKFEVNCQGECILQEVLPLPQRFSMCVQDSDVCGIEVRHQVHISLDLHNHDGHISEVRSTMLGMLLYNILMHSAPYEIPCYYLLLAQHDF
jgi:hypothetical protein